MTYCSVVTVLALVCLTKKHFGHYAILTLLPTAFYDFLSYAVGGDFYPPPQKTMLKLFD